MVFIGVRGFEWEVYLPKVRLCLFTGFLQRWRKVHCNLLNTSHTSFFVFNHNGKESACTAGDLSSIPGLEDPLDKAMATHSRILALEIPWTDKYGGLQSMASQKVRQDWAAKTHFSGGYKIGMEATSLTSLWCFLGRDRNCPDSKMGFILVWQEGRTPKYLRLQFLGVIPKHRMRAQSLYTQILTIRCN